MVLPSISSDLARVRARLGTIAACDSIAPDVREDLLAADRVLRLIERSWGRMVPHLVEDNRRLRSLLTDVTPPVRSAEELPPASEETLDPEQLAGINEELRSALSRLISASGPGEPAVAAKVRRQTAGALRAGLGTRPW